MMVAFAITAGFMAVEAVGGWLAGSLALMADAVHMLTDAAALGLAWGAFRLGRKGADRHRSYGYRRLEVLAAFVNGLAVVLLSAWIVVEALGRLSEPRPVAAQVMLPVAAAGLAVNLLVLRVLRHGHGLNVQGAVLHVIGDLFGSVAAILGAAVILLTGWTSIDPILSLAVAAIILVSAFDLLRSSTHILLEGSPEGFDPGQLEARLLAAVPGLVAVHHVHAWSLTSGEVMLTFHAEVAPDTDRDGAMAAVKAHLAALGFSHSVVQMEASACPDTGDDCCATPVAPRRNPLT